MVELAAHLAAAGWRSHVAVLESPGAAELMARAAELGIPGVTIPTGPGVVGAAMGTLRDLVKEHRIDLVHSHGYKSDIYQLAAALPGRVARMSTCHSWYSDSTRLRAYEAADKAALRLFDHVAAVSPQVRQEVLKSGVPPKRTSLVENGLNLLSRPEDLPPEILREDLGVQLGQLMLLRVGRLDRAKGNDLLLQAAAEVLRQKMARLVLVGEGPEEPALREQARRLGIQDSVVFAGYRQDITALVKAADLMVICSHQEGLPMVLLEAMAAKLPVVSTSVGAVGQLIQNGQTGWLVPPGEATTLASALEEAIGSRHLRQSHALKAHAIYQEHHSREAMGRRYVAIYERILLARQRRRTLRNFPLLAHTVDHHLPRFLSQPFAHEEGTPLPRLTRARPPKVILLLDELHQWRGTETHLFRLLQHLNRDAMEPVVMVLGKDGLASAFSGLGLAFHSLGISRVLAPTGAVGLKKLTDRLRHEEARLVVAYHTGADLLAPLAGATLGIPVISCRRDMGFTKKVVHVNIQRRLNILLQGMISVSHAVAKEVERTEGFPRNLNRVIWNGEDLERFSPGKSRMRSSLGLTSKQLVLTCVGGLSPIKDHKTLLAAFERVALRFPEARLVLAGDGTEHAALERQAASMARKVLFLGQRSDIPELLRGSDIYVQTSRSEGFSNAILQAMAVGLPVVATRAGGNAELITERSGLLADVGDVQAVAQGMEALLSDQGKRRSMGRAGRAWAEDYGSIHVMTTEYEDAFARAMAGSLLRPDAAELAERAEAVQKA